MKIMITGSEGFVGSHLVRDLRDRGHEVVGTDREVDVAKMDSIGWYINDARPDTVIHCAAIAGVAECDRDRSTAFQTNVIGTFMTAGAAAAFGVSRFILFSTGGHMYGSRGEPPFSEHSRPEPPSYYGETKLMSEAALRAASNDLMQLVILRPANIYGPGGRGACEMIAGAMLDGEDVHVTGTGHQSRDYVHIDDVTRLVRLIVTGSGIDGSEPWIYNVGTGVRRTVNDIVRELRGLTGWTGEVIHDEPRLFDPAHVALDSGRAQLIYGWAALTAFESGIESVIPVRA